MSNLAPAAQAASSHLLKRSALLAVSSAFALNGMLGSANAQQAPATSGEAVQAQPGATGTPLPPVKVDPAAPQAQIMPRPAAKARPKSRARRAVAAAPKQASAASTAAAISESTGTDTTQVTPPTAIGVGITGLAVPETATRVAPETLAADRRSTSDTATLLTRAAGVSIYQGGGVSGLPAINGLNGDRVRILLNGMVITSACSNSMNPPLSYSDPAQVTSVEVVSGVTPVSKGGDSIAGTVIVETAEPRFAAKGEGLRTGGSISTTYRSNGHGLVTSGKVEAATQNVSVGYSGAWTRSDNYKGGNGQVVRSSEYESQNHAVTLSVKNGGNLFVVQGGVQFIPYQGYVNQRMDMVNNEGKFLNVRYVGQFGWGKLDARAFYHNISHEMNFLDDKKFAGGMNRDMPMRTEGEDFGYSLKAEFAASRRDLIRFGNEFHGQTLNDWWPPVAGMMMMCCNDYMTINHGTRNRLGTFAEWEHKWDRMWTTLLGVRNDVVWMDAGNVQGYNAMAYGADAAKFNARDHQRTDVNWDATAMARYEPSRSASLEAAYGMKTRSPNLYERYTWTTKDTPMDMGGQMAMNMIGWFGDGNGYVGNLDLKPEVAHTISLTAGWHDGERKEWAFKLTPYYSYVSDYIGVERWIVPHSNAAQGFTNLRFVNHDAVIYGMNASGQMPLIADSHLGKFGLTGIVGYVHGENPDTDVSLYHMMPFYSRLALVNKIGGWTSAIELDLYAGKHNVDTVRNELRSDGYALVNWRTSYEWGNIRFDLGAQNVFDQYYEPALGGTYLYPVMENPSVPKGNVPGMGRSLNAGVTVKF